MAINNTNLVVQMQTHYGEGIALVDESWRRCMHVHTDDVGSKRIAALNSVPELAAWDGSADLTGSSQVIDPDSIGATTLAYSQFAQTIDVAKLLARDVPSIMTELARAQGMAVQSTYATTAWALLPLLHGTETVADGDYAIDTTHHTKDGGDDRDNTLATTLDAAALSALRVKQREWLNHAEVRMDLTQFRTIIMIPSELEDTAVQILQSEFSSSQLQVNPQYVYGNMTYVVAPWLTNATYWYAVVAPEYGQATNPLHFWERSAADYNVLLDHDNLKHRMVVDCAIVADVGPTPDGLFGFGA